ncbi:MAG: RNA polymerase sigma factor [Pirellulales bacterium]|nr:RNA polymerase sigma factor [Pirellulales bacterium]
MSFPPDQLSDQELMREIQGGATHLFAHLIERYQRALVRVAESRLGRRDWAEEAVQETFLAAFKSRATYDPTFGFRTWLWTILLNQCRAHWKTRARAARVSTWTDAERETTTGRSILAAGGTDDAAPFARLLEVERREHLERLLASLPDVQADALRLRFFGGLKFQEIADAMQCSLGTAKNRVRWGLLRLAHLTSSEEQDVSEPDRTTYLRSSEAAEEQQ